MSTPLSVRVERSLPIAEVVLLGPGKGNALGPDFWREAPVVFEELGRDAAVRAILVRGQGSHFSYGLDLPAMAPILTEMLGGGARERTRLLETIGQMQQSIQAIEACPKPVIAAIDGWCVGGGLDLVAACDFRLCSAQAKFSLREVRLAIVADMGSLQRLPRIIGEGHTRELAFTGKDIDAERALRIGLVNDVFSDAEAVLAGARAAAREIASSSPLVVAGIKSVLNHSSAPAIADGLRQVALWNAAFLPSKDLGEALSAFMERRPAVFTGE